MSRISAEQTALALIAFAMPISIAAANLALGFGLLLALWRIVEVDPGRSRLGGLFGIMLLIFLVVHFTAMLLSNYPVHLKHWFEKRWVLAAFVVPVVLIRDQLSGERALYLVMIGGLLAAILALVQNAFGWDPVRDQFMEYHGGGSMAIGPFNHHLTYGGAAMIVALLALARFPFGGSRVDLLRAFFAIILSALGLYVSFARSALVGFGVGALGFVLLAPRKLRYWALGALVTGGAALLALVPGMLTRFTYIFQGEGVGEGPRLALVRSSLRIIREYPLLGVGAGNWREAFFQYGASGRYPSIAHPHSDLLSIAVDGGLISLTLFIAVWVIFFARMIRWRPDDNLAGESHSGESIVRKSALMVVPAIFTAGLFQNYLTDAEVANILWFVVGTALAVESSSRAPVRG
ncbi:MAG: O-antigen ligase family protein [Calditrichaeota bacterium]|nr:O-antigen ligase family protein [Calditrichota bacterium]